MKGNQLVPQLLLKQSKLRNLGKKLQRNPNNPDTSASFHRLRKEYNKTLKNTKYQFQKSVVEQLDSLHENDPKAFWKTLDNLIKKDTQPSNPISMAPWYSYLSNLYSENNDDLDLTKLEIVTTGPLDFPFTCKEVRKCISKLKYNKEPGLDLIHNEFIKLGTEILLLPLVKLFNRILDSGTFPESWNVSSVSIFYKRIITTFMIVTIIDVLVSQVV